MPSETNITSKAENTTCPIYKFKIDLTKIIEDSHDALNERCYKCDFLVSNATNPEEKCAYPSNLSKDEYTRLRKEYLQSIEFKKGFQEFVKFRKYVRLNSAGHIFKNLPIKLYSVWK